MAFSKKTSTKSLLAKKTPKKNIVSKPKQAEACVATGGRQRAPHRYKLGSKFLLSQLFSGSSSGSKANIPTL